MTEQEMQLRNKKLQTAEDIKKLFSSNEFQRVIVNGFLSESVMDTIYRENVDNEAVRDQLKARKILNDYLIGALSDAEIIQQENTQEGE